VRRVNYSDECAAERASDASTDMVEQRIKLRGGRDDLFITTDMVEQRIK